MRRSAAVLLLAAAAAAAAGCAASAGGSVKPYPLDRCLVTDTRLGSMGDPIVRVYKGQEIQFCCPPCVAEFEADPEKYLGLLPK